MSVAVGHPKPPDGVPLEVEFDQHDGFAPDDPAIMAGVDGDNLWRLVLDDAPIGVFDVDLTADEDPTCACMQRSVPTVGFMSTDQRNPGGYTMRLTRASPARPTSRRTWPTSR